jgi:hypothetical protein
MPYAWIQRGAALPSVGVDLVAAEVDITMTEVAVQDLLFAAMQISFNNSADVQYGGGHFGIMWRSGVAEGGGFGKAVNFGSYVDPAGVAAGVPYVTSGEYKLDVGVNLNPSVFGPQANNPLGDRTVGYNWTVGVPVRCRVELINGKWIASFDGVPFREQQWPGTVRMNGMVLWTEYGSPDAPCKVRFSRIRFYDSTGKVYKIGTVDIDHGSQVWDKRVYLDDQGLVMDVGRTPSILPVGAKVDVPTGDVASVSGSRRASDIIARVRSRLDEPVERFWKDIELLGWLNEAMRDAGRYTRHIRDTKQVAVMSGLSEYTLPDDVIEVENAYFLPGDGRQIPLSGQSFDNLDASWGSWQNMQVGEPQTFALWGTPPALKMKLYPSPSQAGTVSMLVVRMPQNVVSTVSAVDWPPAWLDVLEDYMEMAALRKARDPRWQEAFTMYTQKRDMLDTNGDYDTNPQTFVFDGYAGILPRWLVEG